MTDGIIKGNGNSRYLKTVAEALTLYPTYEDFMAALIAGTMPIDLNGVNAAGWDTVGTPLNKANLLTDATAEALGLDAATATPDLAFQLLTPVSGAAVEKGTFVGTGGTSITLTFGFAPSLVTIMGNAYATNDGMMFLFGRGRAFSIAPSTENQVSGPGGRPCTWSNEYKTVKITTQSGSLRMNEAGATYHYMAIG